MKKSRKHSKARAQSRRGAASPLAPRVGKNQSSGGGVSGGQGRSGQGRSGQGMEEGTAGASWRPRTVAITLLVFGIVFLWSYWPTLVELVRAWDREPDYSHGFFVAPLAIYFLWYRRSSRPGSSARLAWGGVGLILASMLIRYVGALAYIDSIDGWSIPIWILGVVWLFWGRQMAWWVAPAAAFLWFMVPLPWRVERWASLPLQGVATRMSTFLLQCFGQPAIAAGNTILLGEQRLEVVDACSGLRIFVGIFALAVAYVICVRRPWWERGLLLLSALPVALVANSTRIVVTGLLYQYVSGDAAHKFSHDISGWVSIPFAALLFAGVLWYIDKLFAEVDVVDVGGLLRRQRLKASE